MSNRSLAIVAMLLVAARADAVPRNTVKAHIDKATKAHKDGKFDVALAELKAAYALDPKPDLLFAIAQVYVKLENCTEAIAYYEKFLAVAKDKKAQGVVTQAIETCKTKLAASAPDVEPKVEPVVEPKVEPEIEPKVEPKVEPEVEPKVEKRDDAPFATGRGQRQAGPSPWYKDPVGDALVVGGVVTGVGGLIMWRAANADIDSANATRNDIATFRVFQNSAGAKQTFSILLAASSGALVTVGLIRYKFRGSKKEPARVVVVPTNNGGLASMMGKF